MIKKIKNIFKFIGDVYDEFLFDKGFKLAAGLSYYTVFSLSPLLVIVISVADFFWGTQSVRNELNIEMTKLLGPEGAKFIDQLITGANQSEQGIFATIISVIILLLGAIGVFLELKESLNIIWGVEPKPGAGILGLIKNRLYLIPLVLTLGFLLVISLMMNIVFNIVINTLNIMPEFLKYIDIGYNINLIIITTIFFTLIYKFLPDIKIKWSYAIRGALVTSILFSLGRYLIGLYLGNSALSSTYGAAASLIIIFIWFYYSGVIFYLAAEGMYIYSKNIRKIEIAPQKDAVRVPKTSQLVKNKTATRKRTKVN